MEIQKIRDVVVLRLTSADLSAPQETNQVLEDLIKVDGERKFVADLGAVPYANSLQLGTLVTLHSTCYENLAVLKLMNMNSKIKFVLRQIGLDKIMQFHHGKEITEASFGGEAGHAGATDSSRAKHRK